MSKNLEQNKLQAKYNTLYAQETVGGLSEAEKRELRVEPVRVEGWPADRKQALVYLARPGGRLLEIGCGQGEVLAALAPYFDEAVGVELSSVRAERTRLALAHLDNVRILSQPLENLPDTAVGLFDCIVWADVIEHVVDVIAAMRILARLSRPGAQLVTVTPNVAFLPQRLNLLRGRAPNTAIPWMPNEGFLPNPAETPLLDGGHLHYFTFRQVEILYQIAGFRPELRLGIGARFARLRNWWPTLLSGLVCVSGSYTGGKQLPVEL